MTKDELCFSLTRFTLEAKKKSGSLTQLNPSMIVISIQLYLAMHGREMRLLNDPEFVSLKNTLDTRMKDLTDQGIRVRRRQAEVITEEEEENMWDTGVLGDERPQQLGDTLLYMLGLHFALRAGSEHRNLRYTNSQISVQEDSTGLKYLCYTEDVSKNRQGGLKHRKIAPKCVRAYENKQNPKRCIVHLYEKYVSHRPTSGKCSPALYLRPLVKPNSNVWYSCQPIGINCLSGTVSKSW